MKEFQEHLLEIPTMGEQDALFCFPDGLSNWAWTELERHRVRDLGSAIATAECLVELKRDSSKLQGRKSHDDSESNRDRDNLPGRSGQQSSRTREEIRRMRHEGNIYASYATGLIGFLSA